MPDTIRARLCYKIIEEVKTTANKKENWDYVMCEYECGIIELN